MVFDKKATVSFQENMIPSAVGPNLMLAYVCGLH